MQQDHIQWPAVVVSDWMLLLGKMRRWEGGYMAVCTYDVNQRSSSRPAFTAGSMAGSDAHRRKHRLLGYPVLAREDQSTSI